VASLPYNKTVEASVVAVKTSEEGIDMLFPELRGEDDTIDDGTSYVEKVRLSCMPTASPFPVSPAMILPALRNNDHFELLKKSGLWHHRFPERGSQGSPAGRLVSRNMQQSTHAVPDPRTYDGIIHDQTAVVERAAVSSFHAAMQERMRASDREKLARKSNGRLLECARDRSDLGSFSDASDDESAPLAPSLAAKEIVFRLLVTHTSLLGNHEVLLLANSDYGTIDWVEGPVTPKADPGACACRAASEKYRIPFVSDGMHRSLGESHETLISGERVTVHAFVFDLPPRTFTPSLTQAVLPEALLNLVNTQSPLLTHRVLGGPLTDHLETLIRRVSMAPPHPLPGHNLYVAPSSDSRSMLDQMIEDKLNHRLRDLQPTAQGTLKYSISLPTACSLFTVTGSNKKEPTEDILGTPVQGEQSLVGGRLSAWNNLNVLGTLPGLRNKKLVQLIMRTTDTLYGPELIARVGQACEGLLLQGTNLSRHSPVPHLQRTYHFGYMQLLFNGVAKGDALFGASEEIKGDVVLTPLQVKQRKDKDTNASFYRQHIYICIGMIRIALSLPEVFRNVKSLVMVTDVDKLERLKEQIMREVCLLDMHSSSLGQEEHELFNLIRVGIPDVVAGEVYSGSDPAGFQTEYTGAQIGQLREWIVRSQGKLTTEGLSSPTKSFATEGDVARMIADGKVKEKKMPAAPTLSGQTALPAAARPGAVAANADAKCPLCGGQETVCGGYKSPTWKCTLPPQTILGVGVGCARAERCGEVHIRFGLRGKPCRDGNTALSAPGGSEWAAKNNAKWQSAKPA